MACIEGCGLHHNSIGSKLGAAFICACIYTVLVHSMLLVVFSHIILSRVLYKIFPRGGGGEIQSMVILSRCV